LPTVLAIILIFSFEANGGFFMIWAALVNNVFGSMRISPCPTMSRLLASKKSYV
jgi:hypothetical protein